MLNSYSSDLLVLKVCNQIDIWKGRRDVNLGGFFLFTLGLNVGGK